LNKPVALAPRQFRSWWPATIGLAVLIILAGWWWLWRPLWQEYKTLPQLAGFEASKQAVLKERANLKKITDEYAQLNALDRTRLALALPQGQDIPNLLAQLEALVQAGNFSIKDLSFKTDKSAETPEATADGAVAAKAASRQGFRNLKIDLIIEGGGYEDLKKFIALTEQSLKLLRLTALNFSSKTAGKTGTIYTLSFETAYLTQ
jgi:hypothetical protein